MNFHYRPSLIQVLGILTLLVFGGGGALIMDLWQDREVAQVIRGGSTISVQIALGGLLGLLIGYVAWAIVSRPFMARVLDRYTGLIGPLMGSRRDRIFVSICAGLGEELFFRGALQHWLGIVLTAVLFVALHGYLDPRSWRVSLYGVVMTFAMVGLGWLAEHYGLLAPIIAHTLIDVVLLEKLHASWRVSEATKEIDPGREGSDRDQGGHSVG